MSHRIDNNRPASAPRTDAATPSTPSARAPTRATPAAGGDDDAFKGTTLAGQRRAFAGHFLGTQPPAAATPVSAPTGGTPAAEAAPAAAVAPTRTEAQVREDLGRSVDRALDTLPGTVTLTPETRERIRASVIENAETAARRIGTSIANLGKVELGFNVNNTFFTAGVSAQVFPGENANTWTASVGVSTPNRAGTSVSVAYGFNIGPRLMNGDASINARLSGPFTVKAGTDGTVTVEHDMPTTSRGGGLPSAGIELSVPLRQLAEGGQQVMARMAAQAERLTGNDRVGLTFQAHQLTDQARAQANDQFRARQQAINAEFDARLRSNPTPEYRAIVDRERGQRLTDNQRQYNDQYRLIQQMNAEMIARIERR
ncbi:hypothetical protein [Archangium primigenium]|uniref:hypothetical protein n=1 Tax=[Archangium] primigenium TaxID=2792470 RepID=UPI00195DCF6C|nr:hypothetical protein [Archangium primigenium]MBM7116049.1 hypothetical protein [Archangium primigenium]